MSERRVVGSRVGVLGVAYDRVDGVDDHVDLLVDVGVGTPIDGRDVEVGGASEVAEGHGQPELGRHRTTQSLLDRRRLDGGTELLQQDVEGPR